MTVNDFEFLASKLPTEKRAEFRALVAVAEFSGCDIDDGFLGFIEDYANLADILERHTICWPEGKGPPGAFPQRTWTVIDIGCANGFQHILFSFADRYIGIDSHFPAGLPKALTPNATFIQGRFADVAPTLKFDLRRTFAIANMSLAYLGQADDLEAFNSRFLHKFMI
jgi:hypothetical protein